MGARLRAAPALLAALAIASPAPAEVPVRAAFDAQSEGLDTGCVSSSQIRTAVEEAVGRPVFADADTADVVVVLRADPAGRATIELEDTTGSSLGTRTLAADSCRELSDAVVLALSLMLDFSRADVARLRESQRPEDAASAEEPAAEDPDVPAAGHVEDPGWEYRVGASLTGAVLLAPDPLLGAAGAIGALPHPALLVELQAAKTFEHRIAVSGGVVWFDSWEAGATLCPFLVELGGPGLRPCVGATAGQVSLTGQGFERDRTGRSRLVRALLELRLEQRVGPVVLGVGLEANAPLAGYRALVSGEEVFRIQPLTLAGNAGIALAFR